MNNLSSSEALGGLYQHSSTASSKANAELISLVDDDEDIDDDHHSTNDDDQEEVENNLTALLSKQQFLRGMQPTLPPQTTTTGAADDMEAVQSMDWLFKKDRIYLLAQFWQQRATLAEKEVNTLKEQLTSTTTSNTETNTTNCSTTNNSTITQNGTSPPSPSTTPLSLLSDNNDNNTTTTNNTNTQSNNKLLNNNNNNNNNITNCHDLDDENMDKKISDVNEMIEHSGVEDDTKSNNNNISNNNCSSNRSTPNKQHNDGASTPPRDNGTTIRCKYENSSTVNNLNNIVSTRTMSEELALKDKEIALLHEEITRLRTAFQVLQDSHNVQMQRIEEHLEGKRQHIIRLENRIGNKTDYDDMKKENSILRSVDLSTTTDSKQFQELLLERTKAFAAQTEALKSSNSDGSQSAATSVQINNSHVNKYNNSFQNLLSPIQQLKNINNKLNNNNNNNTNCNNNNSHNNNSNNINNSINYNNNNNNKSHNENVNNNRPASTPSSLIIPPTSPPELQNVEQFGSMLGEEIVNNWRHSSFIDLPPPPLTSTATTTTATCIPSQPQPSALSKLTASMQNRMINQFPNFTDCLTQNQTHHHLQQLQQMQHHHHQQQQHQQQQQQQQQHHHQDIDKNSSHHDASSTASTPVLQESRSEENLNSRSVTTPMSLPPMSKSPSEDNHPLMNGVGSGGVAPNLLQFNPFGDRGNNHYRFADDLHLPPGAMVGRLGDSLIPKGDPMEARLQEMLRYNMDKYANQNLDTLHISRRVRELLSVHNIGQRLFAKYVLGLSQGTVSELLSKPKPWDKLTEKGRDSYRKMHAWACDDQAVLLLKSLIPKKDSSINSKESGMPQFGGRPDTGDISDERIQHILTEASSMIAKPSPQQQQQQNHHQQSTPNTPLSSAMKHMQMEDSHSIEDSKSPPNCTSPFGKRNMKKYENDDISEEKLQKIYQEEFTKLMSRGQRDAFPNLLFPHFFGAGGGMPPSLDRLADDNIRIALEAYHRELSKLQPTGLPNLPNLPNFTNIPNLTNLLALQHHQMNGGSMDLSVPKEKQQQLLLSQSNGLSLSESESETQKDMEESLRSAFSMVKPKPEPTTTPTTTASSAPSPISHSILPPVTPTDEFGVSASPLQRMASITNSLMSQSPVQSHHSSPQRPLKAVLPPITQQQFDMYNNLNTEDIVRRVKEALSQYSISQRLFGESVLGLSQGSVSDLLARPKPWHMLTQKGREPFIRMKMFLEDENAVHKLVASQYKIAPDKLMRTGNYTNSPQIPANLSKQMAPMPKLMSEQMAKLQDPTMLHLQMSQMAQMAHQAAQAQQNHVQQEMRQRELRERERDGQPMLLTPPGLPPQHAIQLPKKEQLPLQISEKKPMMPMLSPQEPPQSITPHTPPTPTNVMRNMNQHISPTVYEMAALTQDLDTQTITTKIKEALLANNIGQKIFGEAVLGLSQGSVSELLSKPKPWHMLSIKGREPFIRMQLWLNDANNVERLQLLKNERREAIKRRRSTGTGGHDNSSDTSSNDTSEFYHCNSPGPASVTSQSAPPNKKQRVLFSEEQKEALRLAFLMDPYPNVQTIEFLANELNLSTRTITNWFHNHRMRLKQQVPHGQPPAEPIPSRENQSGAPFDPVQFRIMLNQRLMEIQKERMGLSGMPLPYPPYFAANPNLAALIGRGLLNGSEAELAALNNAVKEQIMGMDLSMKRDDDDYDDMDNDNQGDSDNDQDNDDNESYSDSRHNNNNDHMKDLSPPPQAISRTSRRKPAAPQWVNPMMTLNPDWNDAKKLNIPGEKEVIINGVCVMNQGSDFKQDDEEAVQIESTPDIMNESDHTDDEDRNSDNNDEDDEIKKSFIKKPTTDIPMNDDNDDDVKVKKEVEDLGW